MTVNEGFLLRYGDAFCDVAVDMPSASISAVPAVPVQYRGGPHIPPDLAKLPRESMDGVPLGLSWDYAALPRTDSPRRICCQACPQVYEDSERLTSSGQRVLAVLCTSCREAGRLKWLAASSPELALVIPRATALGRSGQGALRQALRVMTPAALLWGVSALPHVWQLVIVGMVVLGAAVWCRPLPASVTDPPYGRRRT